MLRRAFPALPLVGAMLAAAWFVLRVPNSGEAFNFFTTGIPSLAAGEAVMRLLAWLVVLVAAFATFLSMFRGVWGRLMLRHSTSFASLFLVVGLLLLSIGAVQRWLPSASMCCGSGSANLSEAMQLAR